MESAPADRARRRRWSGVAAVLFVLIAGGLAANGAAVAVGRGQTRLAAQAMDTNLATFSAAVKDEVSHYADALADITAAIAVKPDLTATDFHGLTAHLTVARLPGISSAAFVVPATDDQTTAVEKTWRSRGSAGLTLYRTEPDANHAFVVFARTFTGNPVILGRDLNQVTETADTLQISRETQTFTVGAAHILFRDRALPVAEQQMSVTMAAPVLGPATALGARPLRGWVTISVRGGDFLRETLQDQAHGSVQVTLTDPVDSVQTLASVTAGTVLREPELDRSASLEVGHHIWHLDLVPTTSLMADTDRWLKPLTLFGGIAVTVLLGILVTVLESARSRALDQVDAATTALRRDIVRREAVEAQLQKEIAHRAEKEVGLQVLAFTDQLTGLANRGLFYNRVEHALNTHTRAGGTFAVFFIDLDGFKKVNDDLGHGAGDLVLKAVAERLSAGLRDGDTVARFGGDEFAVITEWLAHPSDVHLTADRIVQSIREPIETGTPVLATVTASVGIALNRPGDDADTMVREADMAMYTAKTTGKCRHVLAAAATVDSALEGRAREQGLREQSVREQSVRE